MHRPRCSTKPPNTFRSIVPRVRAGSMAIWDTRPPFALRGGWLPRLAAGAGYPGSPPGVAGVVEVAEVVGVAGAAGIQTRIAPGPRLSHWKYGIAVRVTARSPSPGARVAAGVRAR